MGPSGPGLNPALPQGGVQAEVWDSYLSPRAFPWQAVNSLGSQYSK